MPNDYRDDDLPEEKGTAAKEHEEEIDGILRDMKFGADATAQWVRLGCRVADALEHANIGPTIGYLAMNGRTTDLYITGHLASCPACTMLRKSKEASNIDIGRSLLAKRGN